MHYHPVGDRPIIVGDRLPLLGQVAIGIIGIVLVGPFGVHFPNEVAKAVIKTVSVLVIDAVDTLQGVIILRHIAGPHGMFAHAHHLAIAVLAKGGDRVDQVFADHQVHDAGAVAPPCDRQLPMQLAIDRAPQGRQVNVVATAVAHPQDGLVGPIRDIPVVHRVPAIARRRGVFGHMGFRIPQQPILEKHTRCIGR